MLRLCLGEVAFFLARDAVLWYNLSKENRKVIQSKAKSSGDGALRGVGLQCAVKQDRDGGHEGYEFIFKG